MINMLIYQIWVYAIHGKMYKESYKNNKFKISAPTWNEKFELPDGSYSISDIQGYFEYIWKKHGEKTDNPSIRIYVNKIENRIPFKIQAGYYLELLTSKIMKLYGSNKSKIAIDKNCENVPYLEITEVVLVRCNNDYQQWLSMINNDYQQDSGVLCTFFLINHLVNY